MKKFTILGTCVVLALAGCAGGNVKTAVMPDGKLVAATNIAPDCGPNGTWIGEYVKVPANNEQGFVWKQVGGDRAISPGTCQQAAVAVAGIATGAILQGATAIITTGMKTDAARDVANINAGTSGDSMTWNVYGGQASADSSSSSGSASNLNSGCATCGLMD